MAPRRAVGTTVKVTGLEDLTRDLKKVAPHVEKQLRKDLKDVAQDVAREVNQRVPARSFTYRGASTPSGKAVVRSYGSKAFVARFIDRGFHPRGSSTFVEGRNTVEQVIGDKEDQILDGIGRSVERAMNQSLKH